MGVETLLMASTGLSAVGSIIQGQQQKQYYDTQAAYARDDAKAKAEAIRKATDRQRGEARAALAGSGVDVNAGTALVIDKDITQGGEQDALMEQLSGNRQASLYKTAGKNAMTSGLLGAGQSILGGAMQYKAWKG